MKYFDASKIKATEYKDAVKIKFNNKSISVKETDDGFYINFKRLVDNPELPSYAKIYGNKILHTIIPLSKEAAEMLLFALAKQLGYFIVDK